MSEKKIHVADLSSTTKFVFDVQDLKKKLGIIELEQKLEGKEYDIEKLAVKYVPLCLFEKVALNVEALEKRLNVEELFTTRKLDKKGTITKEISELKEADNTNYNMSVDSYNMALKNRKVLRELFECLISDRIPNKPKDWELLMVDKFRYLLKKLEGEKTDLVAGSEDKERNPESQLSRPDSKPLGDCTSQCGKDWNDSFCSDCNDSKPEKTSKREDIIWTEKEAFGNSNPEKPSKCTECGTKLLDYNGMEQCSSECFEKFQWKKKKVETAEFISIRKEHFKYLFRRATQDEDIESLDEYQKKMNEIMEMYKL